MEFDTNGSLTTQLYDKRDDFKFYIVNFPFIDSNIPESPAYGVFISQLIRYARVCSRYNDFLYRGSILTSKLLRQGYSVEKLKTAFRKFYGRHSMHSDLVGKYNISVSHMLQGLFDNKSNLVSKL